MDIKIPQILQCGKFVHKCNQKNIRYVKDYEFDLYLETQRDMYIDGRYYKISEGALVFRKPGQIVESTGDYNTYILSLDFSGKINIPQEKYLRTRKEPQQELCRDELLEQIPEMFFPYHKEDLKILYKKMIDCSYPNITDTEQLEKLMREFMFLIYADALRYNREANDTKFSKPGYVERACRYINENYAQALSIDKIAEYLSLNKHYLIRVFKRELNITPNNYILRTRLFYAKHLLTETNNSVTNIAFSVGFNTPSYFIKCFKEYYRQTPNSYRNSVKKIT